MSQISTDIVFKNSENGATPNKLNLAFAHARLTAEVITGQPSSAGPTAPDYLLMFDGETQQLVKVPATAFGGGGGGGDMFKATYDTNGNGISDHAELSDSVPWTGVTGKPAAFPPDSSAMLKSVYDTNANNKVDASESADTAPWSGITGRPTSFAPSAHGTTHLDNGTDPLPVVTVVRTGLAPKLSGNAATYLDGTGAYSAVSGSVNPGTWTTLSLGTGWTAPTQAQYRVEINGAVSTVYFRGMIQGAYSVIGTTAFTVPAGGQPSMTRRIILAGAQNTGTPTDVASYVASVAANGVCTIYFLGAGPFVWADPAQTQQVYLDGLFYSL